MSKPLRFSLVMPSLNSARFLQQALASVARQDDPALDLVVADGGSTDGTLALLRTLPSPHRVIEGPDGGSHDAINKAIRASTGDIIGCLNSDDVLAPDSIARVRDAFEHRPDVKAIYSSAAFMEADQSGRYRCRYLWTAPSSDRLPWSLTLGVTCFNAWYFRREVFDEIGFIDERLDFSGDREFLLRVAGRVPTASIEEPLYGYRIHTGSRTMSGNNDNIHAFVMEHLSFAKRLAHEAPTREFADALAYFAAFERGRLALYAARRGRMGDAVGGLARHIVKEIRWPMDFARAVRKRQELYRALMIEWPALPVNEMFPDMR